MLTTPLRSVAAGTGEAGALFWMAASTSGRVHGSQLMGCEEVSKRLWEYLDTELDPEEAQSVVEHLYGCPACRPAFRCRRAFLKLLARQRHACMAPDTFVLRMHRLFQL